MSDNLIFFNFVLARYKVVFTLWLINLTMIALPLFVLIFVGNFDVLRGNWNLEYTSEFQHDIFGRVVCLLRNAVNFQ